MAAGLPTSKRTGTLNRAGIVEAARAVIETDGYEALSLRALAHNLGVTAPALYDHFGSKAQMLRSVAEFGYAELDQLFAATTSGCRAIDRCRARARAYVVFAEERPELFRVMFLYRPAAVLIEADNELAAATQTFDAGRADLVEAVADGDIVDRDITQLNLTIWAGVHGVASIALAAPDLAELVADDVVNALFAGLRPPPT